ncbi:hypothetical protein D9757_005948 [Collybiopsis confluens]|uniref:DUF6533 domain-containing protein n=1 Tax=Collybiopsis confluens TaxID=2823264 RepID=A0A8H5HUJ5_9AGAR|nr:hypothetical protein D9757_005948 [Collybiopsis confluens]
MHLLLPQVLMAFQSKTWIMNTRIFAALWIADFIATLPTEIRTMWLKKPTGTSVLFILNRYSFLLFLSIALVKTTPGNSTDQECQILYNSSEVLELLSVGMTSALFTLRVYAIYNKSRIILVVSALLITFRLFTDTVFLIFSPVYSTSGSAFEKFSRCEGQFKDTLLFNHSLPNILISRLVLNLRAFSSLEETRSQRITTISGMNFATNRMLGNIGAPLQSGEEEQEEEEDVDE